MQFNTIGRKVSFVAKDFQNSATNFTNSKGGRSMQRPYGKPEQEKVPVPFAFFQ